jgi:hypothetical protein
MKLEETKHESREREKLFWLVLLSSGSHEKLYGPGFRLLHLQPALKVEEWLEHRRQTMALSDGETVDGMR